MPFESDVEWELFLDDESNYKVAVRYNGANLNLSHTSVVCDEDGECDARSFIDFTKNFSLNRTTSEACFDFKKPTLIEMTSWILMGVASVLMIGVFLVLWMSCTNKRKVDKDPTERFRFMKEKVRSDHP